MILNAKGNKSTSRLKPAGLARNRNGENRTSEEALYFSLEQNCSKFLLYMYYVLHLIVYVHNILEWCVTKNEFVRQFIYKLHSFYINRTTDYIDLHQIVIILNYFNIN